MDRLFLTLCQPPDSQVDLNHNFIVADDSLDERNGELDDWRSNVGYGSGPADHEQVPILPVDDRQHFKSSN